MKKIKQTILNLGINDYPEGLKSRATYERNKLLRAIKEHSYVRAKNAIIELRNIYKENISYRKSISTDMDEMVYF